MKETFCRKQKGQDDSGNRNPESADKREDIRALDEMMADQRRTLPETRKNGTVLEKMRNILHNEIMPGEKHLREESLEEGKALRKKVRRSSFAEWMVQEGRTQPLEILEEQEKDRVSELLPIRHARMKESAFAYYRGTAAVMAADLATKPVTGIMVQACGDAHIGNFGVFGTGESRYVLDINDFDETYPGPWEWDVLRLAASVEICGRYRGFPEETVKTAVMNALNAYHDAMTAFSGMGTMEVWYSHLDVEALLSEHQKVISGDNRKMIHRVVSEASSKNSFRAVHKWTETVDGRLQIRSIPPILVPFRDLAKDKQNPERMKKLLKVIMEQYRLSLPREMRNLIDQYTPVDFAGKVVGVGSVGTRSMIVVLEGCSIEDPLVLQIKEAGKSVLAPYVKALPEGGFVYAGKKTPEQEAGHTAADGETGGTGETWPAVPMKTGTQGSAAGGLMAHAEKLAVSTGLPAGHVEKIAAHAKKLAAGAERFAENNGRRVVSGQKAIQTAGDLLLGWLSAPDLDGKIRDFYVRQLWNNKGTINLETVSAENLEWLAGICGWVLAHAHARTGNRHAIAGYLGRGRKFEEAAAEFAAKYADQNEKDYEVYVQNVRK